MNITNYEFYEEFSRDSTSENIMKEYFQLENLTPTQICITIAHINIYKKIINNNFNFCLILEDDALFNDNFINNFNNYLSSCPKDIDIACINNGCNLHADNIIPDKIWYSVKFTRTCCAYLITNNCCKKIIKTIIPFKKAIDHELNYQIKLHNLNVYWTEPTLISDGSETIYKSSYIQY
jgi:GR25 family glycosyltransferase involved in LPS biosynthesis